MWLLLVRARLLVCFRRKRYQGRPRNHHQHAHPTYLHVPRFGRLPQQAEVCVPEIRRMPGHGYQLAGLEAGLLSCRMLLLPRWYSWVPPPRCLSTYPPLLLMERQFSQGQHPRYTPGYRDVLLRVLVLMEEHVANRQQS